MQNPELIIAPAFFLSFFGMIFGIMYMRNKENMALIDKGINPRKHSYRMSPKPYVSLKFGLLLAGVGFGLLLAFLVDQHLVNHKAINYEGHSYERDFPQVYLSLIGLFGGLGLVISYMIEKKEWMNKNPIE